MTDYHLLHEQLAALTRGVPHEIANLANASAAIWQALENINWAGFYLFDGEKLILGPFQGKPACIEIPLHRGVCGAAARKGETLVVADVHTFPGHIACDCASNSEIVVPMFKNGVLYGVLDIDSPLPGRFSDADREGLEQAVRTLEESLFTY